MTGRSAVTTAVVFVLGMAAAACGVAGEGRPAPGPAESGPTVASRPLVAGAQGLCLARKQADTDVQSVRATFYDRAHEPLHTIARDLERVDRTLAARLLEATQAVEADVNAQIPPPGAEAMVPAATLAADLDHLIDVTARGLARLSVAPVPCR